MVTLSLKSCLLLLHCHFLPGMIIIKFAAYRYFIYSLYQYDRIKFHLMLESLIRH